eukprot:COSAG01_NODE_50_length_31487_cov_90.470243_7_plen_92_part_00
MVAKELEAHPSRKSFNRRRILSVLCDEYLAAIVIPTLQSWLDVFTLIDWNHSRTLGFHELKQGLCACNTPEGVRSVRLYRARSFSECSALA